VCLIDRETIYKLQVAPQHHFSRTQTARRMQSVSRLMQQQQQQQLMAN
jgi:hypothetical protein